MIEHKVLFTDGIFLLEAPEQGAFFMENDGIGSW